MRTWMTLLIFLVGSINIPLALKGKWLAIISLGICWGLGYASLILRLAGK